MGLQLFELIAVIWVFNVFCLNRIEIRKTNVF